MIKIGINENAETGLRKRLLSLLLVFALCLSLCVTAFAAGEGEEIEEAPARGASGGGEIPAGEASVPETGPDAPVTDGAGITDSGTCGELLTWTLGSDGVLTISGEGEMSDFFTPPWYDCRADITTVVIESGVTSIGEKAFYRCGSLVSISIPDSVVSIGEGAFYYCTSLSDIRISDGNPDYSAAGGALCNRDKTELIAWPAASGSIEIPYGVTAIGNGAFYACGSLTEIAIPDSVTTIGDNAFFRCAGLTDVTLPFGVTTIGNKAFGGCGSLTSVTIPGSVTSIGNHAFYACGSLVSVAIPGSVTSIGESAFESCGSLTGVYLENGVTTIGGAAFSFCGSLASVIIPASVEKIEYNAFESCADLSEIIFLGDAPAFERYVFLFDRATVYYPAGNASWKEAIMRDYGGHITWTAYRDLRDIPDLVNPEPGSAGAVGDASSHIPGDVNSDRTVDISDVQTLLKYVNGQEVPVDDAATDVNGDKTVDISDVQALLKYVNGQEVTIF